MMRHYHRYLISLLALLSIILTACASMDSISNTRYETEQNANQFVGANIQTVLKQWGKPDQALHTAENTSYYVYTTKTDTSSGPAVAEHESPLIIPGGKAIGLPIETDIDNENILPTILCTTTFKTNNTGTILWVKHQGSSCLGKWINTTEK